VRFRRQNRRHRQPLNLYGTTLRRPKTPGFDNTPTQPQPNPSLHSSLRAQHRTLSSVTTMLWRRLSSTPDASASATPRLGNVRGGGSARSSCSGGWDWFGGVGVGVGDGVQTNHDLPQAAAASHPTPNLIPHPPQPTTHRRQQPPLLLHILQHQRGPLLQPVGDGCVVGHTGLAQCAAPVGFGLVWVGLVGGESVVGEMVWPGDTSRSKASKVWVDAQNHSPT